MPRLLQEQPKFSGAQDTLVIVGGENVIRVQRRETLSRKIMEAFEIIT
jgi:hypothetical protein